MGDAYAFTGLKEVKGTGVLLAWHRAEDLANGRWMSQDPIWFRAGDANLYRYGRNSPTNATDPTGLVAIPYTYYITASPETIRFNMDRWPASVITGVRTELSRLESAKSNIEWLLNYHGERLRYAKSRIAELSKAIREKQKKDLDTKLDAISLSLHRNTLKNASDEILDLTKDLAKVTELIARGKALLKSLESMPKPKMAFVGPPPFSEMAVSEMGVNSKSYQELKKLFDDMQRTRDQAQRRRLQRKFQEQLDQIKRLQQQQDKK